MTIADDRYRDDLDRFAADVEAWAREHPDAAQALAVLLDAAGDGPFDAEYAAAMVHLHEMVRGGIVRPAA